MNFVLTDLKPLSILSMLNHLVLALFVAPSQLWL